MVSLRAVWRLWKAGPLGDGQGTVATQAPCRGVSWRGKQRRQCLQGVWPQCQEDPRSITDGPMNPVSVLGSNVTHPAPERVCKFV